MTTITIQHNGQTKTWNFNSSKKLDSILKNIESKYNEFVNTEFSLTNMSLGKYGRGYLLTCEDTHKDWGTKYYHGGWWNTSANGWFFKKEFKDNLIKMGASFGKHKSSSDCEQRLSGMVFKKYGAGYLLTCDKSHKDWGRKYYFSGWWKPQLNGWFFKPEFKQKLMNLGATSFTNSKKQSKQGRLTDMKLEKYGAGYLLTCNKSHKDWGRKYYFSGWWKPDLDGWFFKSQYKEKLMNLGATF